MNLDLTEPKKTITVRGIGLCYHLATRYDQEEWRPDQTPAPTAQCLACKKKWVFSKNEGRFVEIV